ncbi:glycerol-3-phosphate acyltransferase 1, mitochondrial isoform X1 [Microplitis mediator]|uniref:glycerol-3-phosphate acyltransferase 1, mitochondrial isoform X1 n=2 Tax=Microplitis mediator TaxID=375433 RepID=UPI002553F061|nr:glycerol-3-phosphate acyltransferase 1, mitochondrial isoform X1 [Microplitis mediator]
MTGIIEIFIFCGVLYYLYNLRGSNMLDVLSTRIQEVYAKWESRTDVIRDTEDNGQRLSLDGLRRAGQQSQRRRIQNREQIRKLREGALFKIKETELFVPPVPKITSFLYQCCQTCTPTSRGTFASEATKQHQSLGRNILLVEPCGNIFSKIFYHFSFISNVKKYDYPRVTHTVLNDERLKEAIKLTAIESSKNDNISEEEAMARAETRAKTILSRMESTMSHNLLRLTGWILFKLLPLFMKAVIVQDSQVEMVQKANNRGVPLIFLPLHRSHLDYIVISFVLLCNDVRNSLIAAGDNLRIPIFGKLLSGLGAFYIKRRIDPVQGRKDMLYRATLHTYVMESLRAGHNIEFFIEGGRTRTGKPCMPKGGILSIIIDAYMDGTIEDALLVPVSLNYDRLVDGNFIREQLGQPKKPETFGSAIKAIWSTLRGSYGLVKIDICEPFSLREMIKSIDNQQTRALMCRPVENKSEKKILKATMSTSSLYGTDVVDDEHRLLVDCLARHVVYDCARSTPIMSTNVVAFLLLNKFREGCTLDKLVEAFDSLKQELEWTNKDIAFCGETIDVINYALEILGPGLVKQERQEIIKTLEGESKIIKKEVVISIQPVSMLPNVIELAYYSNSMMIHYVMDSIVISALYAALKEQINDPRAIAENKIYVFQHVILEKAVKLCDILKQEFIFCKPCQDLEYVIITTIENLSYSGILSLCEESYLEEELWSRRYAKNFDNSSDEEYANKTAAKKIQYKLNLEADSSGRMEFLHTILRPIIDTYTFSAFTLRKLVGRTLVERDLVQEVLREIKMNIDREIVYYGESLSVEPIKNSLKLFEKWQVLECHPEENAKIYYLRDEYDNDEAANQIYESIEVFKWTKQS